MGPTPTKACGELGSRPGNEDLAERGPEEGGGDVSKISQRGKTPKRLRRGGCWGVVISKTKLIKRGGGGRGGARFSI